MDERTQERPQMETRRTSSSVDMGTQTEEQQAPEHKNTSVARRRSLGGGGQLAQRPPAPDAAAIPRPAEDMMPQQRQDHGGAPAVRLDMDLDIDVNLRAKIQGELELSILDSEQANRQRRVQQQ